MLNVGMEQRPHSLLRENHHSIIIPKSRFNFSVHFYLHFIGNVTIAFGQSSNCSIPAITNSHNDPGVV